ncbi:MAG: molecular chaperone HtpG [Pseudomonadota bacterium]|nr:molecular chaperone HtpG [Pseudomonadota bacterium]
MSHDTQTETRGFQAEVRQLLDLMIHSLYSNKEIFLRELISNASDAAERLRFEALGDAALFESDSEIKIEVEYSENLKTITVRDNGIGMSRQELVENLGTIAKSGTQEFFKALTGDRQKDSQLIGQFGVGFYSAFIVAEEITVTTRRAGLGAEEGVRWLSDGKGEYSVRTVPRKQRGTEVVLKLRAGEEEFLNGYRLRSIIGKYSDHITLPILMPKEGKDASGYERVNAATALWSRPKGEITDEEYNEFYKHVAHDHEAPLARIHSKVEGKLEYTLLLFLPKHAPFDLWDPERRRGVKLFVRRVFIMDDATQLMPRYLRFVRGIVDSNDLPLNISREILQDNKIIDGMRAGAVKKVLGLLEELVTKGEYGAFWKTFGRVLKEGLIEDASNHDRLTKLARFSSTHTDSEEQEVSLDDYLSRMKEGQSSIYYVVADGFATAKNSPHLEVFRKKGIEVLLLSDPVDDWAVTQMTEYSGKPLKSVSKGALDLGALEDKEDKAAAEAGEYKDLVERIRKSLAERVKEVRVTHRLTTSPACLVADDHELGANLERLLKAAGQDVPATPPILEINPEHPIVRRLHREQEGPRFEDWARILFDQALLSEGGRLDDPAGFVHRLNEMFLVISGEAA